VEQRIEIDVAVRQPQVRIIADVVEVIAKKTISTIVA